MKRKRPSFEDLPFDERPDLTPYLIHLTRGSEEATAFENLVNILRSGRVLGSTGFVQGGHHAACFMDVPFVSLKYVFKKGRYEPYDVFLTKKAAYERGCRPVLYLSNKEKKTLGILEFREKNGGGWSGCTRTTRDGSVGCTNGNGAAKET